MLTRRGFAGFASCAICGITEFVATAASAQGAPPAASGGVTRKILSQTDGPMPGYVTVLVEAIIEPGVPLGRHTHPGIESAYVLEGGFELPEFAFELEGVQTDTRGQNLDRIGIKLQAALANSRGRPFDEGLFVSSKTKIWKILNVCVRKPRKRFEGRSAFVGQRGA